MNDRHEVLSLSESNKTGALVTIGRSKKKKIRDNDQKSDDLLSASRCSSDRKRLLSRDDHDASREHERLGDLGSISHERDNADARLLFERQSFDDDLERERNRADAVTSMERDQAAYAADLFMDEQAAHALTSATLTTRNEFLAIVSHDLKNPLACISMAADLLKDETGYADGTSSLRFHVDLIQRNADMALRLIADLLDMERVSSDKLELSIELRPRDLLELIRNTVEMQKEQALVKDLSLILSLPAVPMVIPCDGDRISQVLSNLVGNAIKFTPPGGSITVAAKLDLERKHAHVSVIDTGSGIPIEEQKSIFERFSQLNKKDRSGLGLGLYISKMIIASHHGAIWVESWPGVGSSFQFTLPLGTS